MDDDDFATLLRTHIFYQELAAKKTMVDQGVAALPAVHLLEQELRREDYKYSAPRPQVARVGPPSRLRSLWRRKLSGVRLRVRRV